MHRGPHFSPAHSSEWHRGTSRILGSRMLLIAGAFAVLFCVLVLRIAQLQILQHKTYEVLASGQHDLDSKLLPIRGRIFVRDPVDNALHPFAINRDAWTIYAVPRSITDAAFTATSVASVLQLSQQDILTTLTKKPDDPYEPILKNATTDQVSALQALHLDGIGFVKTTARLYPEQGVSGQLIGFVSPDESGGVTGKYGVEGAYNEILAGKPGRLVAEKDASGRRLTIADTHIEEAVNGSDVVLTIDRTIQYEACAEIQQAVKSFDAKSGSIVVMDPNTGAVLAMCSAPDFDPTTFGQVTDLSVLNNPVVFSAYEPGSIFKAITMAAGVNEGKVNPKTTYFDTGAETIDEKTIHNSDLKAHGIQTMTQALDESLNTGMIFVERLLGKEKFRSYVDAFGFGKKTGIELSPEGKGNITSLARKGEIFHATASFGQGITVTPIQILSAYAAIANGGTLMRPYVVSEIIHPDGTRDVTKPQVLSRPIDARTSRVIAGMLVSVVENGHGKRAGVPGYWVAGKTGTAQVARTNGLGYEKDATIGSFAGFAPASDPKFVMLVKIDRPRDVLWAEASAAPVFGKMAQFLLTYFHVPTERAVTIRSLPSPRVASSTSAR